MLPAPSIRVEACNDVPVRADGAYVLYWMIAARRCGWNYALQHALHWARRLRRPLVVLEELRCGERWCCDRFHRFVLDGMADNAQRIRSTGARYYPYVEAQPAAGQGLLAALAADACLVVTDEFPCTSPPRMVAAAAARIAARLEQVDSNGLLPLRAADATFATAHAFRRFLQRELPRHIDALPEPDPLGRVRLSRPPRIPAGILERWPAADDRLRSAYGGIDRLPIDHSVAPAAPRGGSLAGQARLRRFVRSRLALYAESRNHPDEDGCSGLSPYLHFGHVSAHEVFAEVARHEGWTRDRMDRVAQGRKSGWWGMSASAEAFLDELVTWRELGFNFAHRRDDFDRYETLPQWARSTLEAHARDRREHVYEASAFEAAATHDPLWNAAQAQLVREGRVHGYVRMLWGKKIVEWSRSPREALDLMIELNNKYALDGRDPNSYSGILWVLGRYDRPWPERPVFGSVRYMSSASALRKLRCRVYLRRYGPAAP